MTSGIEVDGARELRRALRQVEDGVSDLKTVHASTARIVEQRAEQLTPVRSGLLRSTVRSTGQASGGVIRAGYARVPYAGPIHFGWRARNIRPQPFLYDALDERRTQVFDAYRKQVDALIERHGLN